MPIRDDQFYLDAYTGGGGFQTGAYLEPHPVETTESYQLRQKLAVYPNFTRKVCKIYLGTLFREQATRLGEAQAWGMFMGNADGVGGRIDDLMQRAVLLAMLLGTVHLVVDRPRGQPQTQADEANLMPYCVVRLPGDIAAQRIDSRGHLVQVVYREDENGALVYRGWEAQRWWVAEDVEGKRLLKDAAGQALTGEHKLGRVPVHRLHSEFLLRVTDPRATAWAAGIAELNGDLYQRWSELRNLERKQSFSILTLPVTSEEEAQRLTTLDISTDNALPYNPAGGGRPGYISPSPDPQQKYADSIASCIEMIYKLANLEFVGGVQSSGIAMQFHFQSANDAISLMASEAEKAEMAIGQLACAWMGQEWDGSVQYPRRFQTDILAAELKEAMDATTLDLGPTANALVKGRIARRMIGDQVTEAQIQKIDSELLAAGDLYGDRIAKEAALGAAK